MVNNQALRNILVPIDFEKDSPEILELGTRFAARDGATLHLLTVVAPDSEEKYLARLDHLAHEYLSKTPHKIHVVVGNAAPEILKMIREENIDLVIIRTHGRKGLRRALLGSVAERVVRESPVPVLTVKPL